MSLFESVPGRQLGQEEFDYLAATRQSGFGEYLGAKFSENFDYSLLGRAYQASQDISAGVDRFGPLPPDKTTEQAKEMGFEVATPRLTEEQWKKSGLARDGLAFEGGTLDHERSRTDEYDRRRYRDSVIARYSGNPLAYIAGFAASVAGGGVSPENFIPFVGPIERAAMAARLGVIGSHAAAGAIDATLGTALTDVVTLPDLARRGEDVGPWDFAMDLAVGAVAGTALGSWGGWHARRQATANAIRFPGVEPMGDALSHTVEAIDTGEPVNVDAYLRSDPQIIPRLERSMNERAAAAESPRVEITGGTGPLAPQIKADHDQARAHSDRLGLTTEIERLVYEGKTAKQIAQDLAPRMAEVDRLTEANGGRPADFAPERENFVRMVRNTLGAPSATDHAELAAWRQAYEQRRAASVSNQALPLRVEPTPGRTITRTINEPDGYQEYTVSEGGREVLKANIGVYGDTVRVGAIGAAEPDVELKGAFGGRQLRELAAAIKRDNPEVQWIEGERVTGARRGTDAQGAEARVSIDRLIGARRTPDLTTTAAEHPSEPSVVAAEKTYKVIPPDFTSEQSARIKEEGLDAETAARDQAIMRRGDLTPAQQAELEAADLEAKAHEDYALAHEAMAVCAGRFD